MKSLICIALAFLVCLTSCSPIDTNDELTITPDIFVDEFVLYTAEYDIVSILAPLNSLNFDDDNDEGDNDSDPSATIFFALADFGANGERTDKGLYILKNKVATKLLDNGRDTTPELGDTKVVYFGASDGLYKYNAEENKAEKYGTITDSIIQLAKVNGTDAIYILTADKELYKVTEEGTKKTKVEEVTSAKEIAIDYGNNLYFIGADNKPYVLTADGVKEISGFSADSSYTKLIRPPFVIENGLPFISGNKGYIIYSNGTRESSDITVEAKPSAYSMEGALLQYYGYNKKIYEYNILLVLLGSALEEMKKYLDDFSSDIQKIASRSRSDMRP